MSKEELYKLFLVHFPNFETQIKHYKKTGDREIKIFTKYGKSFIFEVAENGDISLRQN